MQCLRLSISQQMHEGRGNTVTNLACGRGNTFYSGIQNLLRYLLTLPFRDPKLTEITLSLSGLA